MNRMKSRMHDAVFARASRHGSRRLYARSSRFVDRSTALANVARGEE